jgi:hypothetical protein
MQTLRNTQRLEGGGSRTEVFHLAVGKCLVEEEGRRGEGLDPVLVPEAVDDLRVGQGPEVGEVEGIVAVGVGIKIIFRSSLSAGGLMALPRGRVVGGACTKPVDIVLACATEPWSAPIGVLAAMVVLLLVLLWWCCSGLAPLAM